MAQSVSDKIAQNFTQYPKRLYPKGQILIFADEDPEHIFYILKGKVVKYDIAYNGEEMIVNVFKPGAFFPMSWAVNRVPNQFFYKTEGETELHVIPAEAAFKFLKANPDVLMDLLERIYRGTEGLLQRIVQLMVGTAKDRLLLELLIETRRFGKKDKNGIYRLNINEQELASRAGMSRETVSREMKKLKSAKLVKLDQGMLVIPDLNKLEQSLKS